MTAPLTSGFLSISPRIAAHVAAAMDAYQRRFRDAGMATPQEFGQLLEQLANAATSGQDVTDLDSLAAAADAADVPRRLLTYAQVARSLTCHERTVRRLIDSGALPRVRIGGSVRVRAVDLDRFVENLTEEESC